MLFAQTVNWLNRCVKRNQLHRPRAMLVVWCMCKCTNLLFAWSLLGQSFLDRRPVLASFDLVPSKP